MIIQIGLSTDFRYMTGRVRGTAHDGLYAIPSRCTTTLRSPYASPTLPPPLVPLVVVVSLSLGHRPNGIVQAFSTNDVRLVPSGFPVNLGGSPVISPATHTRTVQHNTDYGPPRPDKRITQWKRCKTMNTNDVLCAPKHSVWHHR